MEWIPVKLTRPVYSGYYEVRVRIQLDLFDNIFDSPEVDESNFVKTAWYDKDSDTFKERNTKTAKKVEHVDAWRSIEM